MTRKEEIEQAAKEYYNEVKYLSDLSAFPIAAFKAGAEWADKTAWKPADGDNLPEIDREVVALVEVYNNYMVIFAHRPNPNGDAICYDKGEWNQPNVKWWLDLELPMTTQEEIPYTKEEVEATAKTIQQLRKEKQELIDRVKECLYSAKPPIQTLRDLGKIAEDFV